MTTQNAASLFRSVKLLAVIALLLHAEFVFGDALDAMSEADAKRAATVFKAGDIQLQLCRTCNTFGMNNGELTVSKIISVEAAPRKERWYAENFPYQVLVTKGMYFWATSVSITKDKKEITAIGNCMVPEENNYEDQGCYGYLGDSNEPHAFKCKEAASQNYTYFLKEGLWSNLATISQDDAEAVRWRDTVRLSDSTWLRIKQCQKSYEESILSKSTASKDNSNGATSIPLIPHQQTASSRPKQYEEVFSVCSAAVPVGHTDFSLANNVGPSTPILGYFMSRGQAFDIKTWQVTLIDGPKHGVRKDSIYYPNDGYLGPDQLTYVVEAQGKKFKIIETVWVSNAPPEYGGCPKDYKLPVAE